MRGRRGYVCGLALLVLTACDQDSDITVPGTKNTASRHYAASATLSGDYGTKEALAVMNWRFRHLHLASPAEADAAEKAVERYPVAFVFENTEGERNADGDLQRLVVVGQTYNVTDDAVVVTAVSAGVGAVRFEGRPSGGGLTGTLVLGNNAPVDVRLEPDA